MGGSTITRCHADLKTLLNIMASQIEAAANMGLGVDSELIALRPDVDEPAKIYKVIYTEDDEIEFQEAVEGRAFHIGVAGRFGPKPKPGEWVATVHVHT